MATPYVTFGVPDGFPAVAKQLRESGFGIDRHPDLDQEVNPRHFMDWRSWNVSFPSGEVAMVFETAEPRPEIYLNLNLLKDGKDFRRAILNAGAIEGWDGEEINSGFFWRRYYKRYRKVLGDPKTEPGTNKRLDANA